MSSKKAKLKRSSKQQQPLMLKLVNEVVEQLASLRTDVNNLAATVKQMTTLPVIQNADLHVRYGEDALVYLDILNLLAASRISINGGGDVDKRFIQEMQNRVFASFEKNSATSTERYPASAIPEVIAAGLDTINRDITFAQFGYRDQLLGREDFPELIDPDSSWFSQEVDTSEGGQQSVSSTSQHNQNSEVMSEDTEEEGYSRTHVSTSPELPDPPVIQPRPRRQSNFFANIRELEPLEESPQPEDDAVAEDQSSPPAGLSRSTSFVVRRRTFTPEEERTSDVPSNNVTSPKELINAPEATDESIRNEESERSEDNSLLLSTPRLARSGRAVVRQVLSPQFESLNLEGPLVSTPTTSKREAGWQLVEARNRRLSQKAERDATRLSANFGSEQHSPILSGAAGGGGSSASLSSGQLSSDSVLHSGETTIIEQTTVILQRPTTSALPKSSPLAGTSRWSDPNFRKMKEDEFRRRTLAMGDTVHNEVNDDDEEPYGLPEEWLRRHSDVHGNEESEKIEETAKTTTTSSSSKSNSRRQNRQGSLGDIFSGAGQSEDDDDTTTTKSLKKKGGKGKKASKVIEVNTEHRTEDVAAEEVKENLDAPGPSKPKAKRGPKSKKTSEVNTELVDVAAEEGETVKDNLDAPGPSKSKAKRRQKLTFVLPKAPVDLEAYSTTSNLTTASTASKKGRGIKAQSTTEEFSNVRRSERIRTKKA